MYLHTFDSGYFPILQPGALPRLERISRSCNNPSWFYTLHLHKDCTEIMFIADGEATITIGQHVFSAGKGDLFLIDRSVIHALESSKEYPSDIWCCLLSDVAFAETPCGDLLSTRANAGDFYSFLLNTFRTVQDFSYQEDSASYEICRHLISACLIIFHELLLNAHFKFEIKNPTLAQEILIYLNEHYKEKINLELLSKVFFTSASHISSEFKKEFRLSPINYLIDKRLSEARWLLINTNETIQSIADRVGYPNHYYFTRLFQTRTGFTPSDYRERYSSEKGMIPK